MKKRYTLPAVAVSAVMTAPAAYALNFDFSFTGLGGGTVTGEIFGLAGSARSHATDVQIDSAPGKFALPSTPFDLFPETLIEFNTFTVGAGNIVSAHFSGGRNDLFLNLHSANVNGLFLANGFADAATSNYNGFAGVTYSAASSVPEPATIALLGAGLAGIRAFRRHRTAA